MTDEHPTSTAPYEVVFTVETQDLRQALSSVVVHAYPKADAPSLNRVRLAPGPECANNRGTPRGWAIDSAGTTEEQALGLHRQHQAAMVLADLLEAGAVLANITDLVVAAEHVQDHAAGHRGCRMAAARMLEPLLRSPR